MNLNIVLIEMYIWLGKDYIIVSLSYSLIIVIFSVNKSSYFGSLHYDFNNLSIVLSDF